MQDRSPRTRVLKGAKIIFNNGSSVIDALARNVSDGGASLDVSVTAGIPAEFELQLAGERVGPCQIRWKRDGRVGVKFLARG